MTHEGFCSPNAYQNSFPPETENTNPSEKLLLSSYILCKYLHRDKFKMQAIKMAVTLTCHIFLMIRLLLLCQERPAFVRIFRRNGTEIRSTKAWGQE